MINELEKKLKKLYASKPHRFAHVLGVRDTAVKLGLQHNVDIKKLEIAALLHDITKYFPFEGNVKLITKYYDNSEKIIKEYNKEILHAFSATVVAQNEYGITDSDILDAIRSHTIGKPAMSPYEQILFVSDYIEPNRTYESCIRVRKIAETSLDLATFTALDDSIKYYEARDGLIPKTAYEAREYYKQLLEEPK